MAIEIHQETHEPPGYTKDSESNHNSKQRKGQPPNQHAGL
jgi:hypothetical protein